MTPPVYGVYGVYGVVYLEEVYLHYFTVGEVPV